MADPVLNTQTTLNTIGLRESLASIIAKVDPVDTPCYTNFAKTRAKARLHQWQEWKIAAETAFTDKPVAWLTATAYVVGDVVTNGAPSVYYRCIQDHTSGALDDEPGEGAVADDFWTTDNPLAPYRKEGENLQSANDPVDDPTPTTLYENITSIFWEPAIVSGTLQAIDVAGRENELSWQKITQAMEVRRNVERAILRNISISTAPEPCLMAGLPTWADGGDGTAPSTVTPAYDNVAVELAMQTLHLGGATADTLVMSPADKKTFSESVQAATTKNIESAITDREMVKWGLGTVSIYLTDLGTIQVVVDRYISADVTALKPAFLFDSSKIRIAELAGRVFAEQVLDPTGDAHKRMILWSGTLEVTSPKSVAIPV